MRTYAVAPTLSPSLIQVILQHGELHRKNSVERASNEARTAFLSQTRQTRPFFHRARAQDRPIFGIFASNEGGKFGVKCVRTQWPQPSLPPLYKLSSPRSVRTK